jgi:parallel beta-helix repeat protein
MGTTDVEITGFVIQHFEWGIYVQSTSASLVHLNEARFNSTVVRTGVPAKSRGFGILLESSNDNAVSQNTLQENGRNGIVVRGSSTGNVVRANWLKDNNLDGGSCNLMVTGTASLNSIVENEVVGTLGSGIMIGPGLATGNRVAQNRIQGFAGPGIILMASTVGNFIEQNQARGNGLSYGSPQNVDLFDSNAPGANAWNRNLGACGPGVC